MSSFAGVAFKVNPSDQLFYPRPAPDPAIGLERFECSAHFATKALYDAIKTKRSIVTWKRPLGALVANGAIEAGHGKDALVIPAYGGTTESRQAVLEDVGAAKVYGKTASQEYIASLKFVIVS